METKTRHGGRNAAALIYDPELPCWPDLSMIRLRWWNITHCRLVTPLWLRSFNSDLAPNLFFFCFKHHYSSKSETEHGRKEAGGRKVKRWKNLHLSLQTFPQVSLSILSTNRCLLKVYWRDTNCAIRNSGLTCLIICQLNSSHLQNAHIT